MSSVRLLTNLPNLSIVSGIALLLVIRWLDRADSAHMR